LISFDVATRLTTDGVRDPLVSQLTGIVHVASDGFEIRRLDATLRDAPLASLRAVMPGLPLGGAISGRITLSGPPERAPLAINVRLEVGSGVALAEGRVDLTGAVPATDAAGCAADLCDGPLFDCWYGNRSEHCGCPRAR
jgi:hypothetical protein